MDRVLVIAYYFPPMGGAGVQRTLKFVKYLPQYGWQPHVLTVHESSVLEDSSLEKELPAELSITRTHILRLPKQFPWRLRNFISRWILIIDEQIGWLPYAKKAARRVISSDNQIKAIYSTSSPFTSHLIAHHLHDQTHLPWVADFRDPWMGNPYMMFPTSFHRKINEDLEKNVFTESDRVILNTESSQNYYVQKYPTLPAKKFSTIANGYDVTDLPSISQDIPTNSVFTIAHLGSLYQRTRSSEYFLAALHEVIVSGKLPANKIRVRFIGNIDKETQGLVRQFKLGKNVELIGYLSHSQAMSELFAADLLLLIPSYGVGSELFVPAKLYEYLASRKPIICLSDPGETADLVHKARAGMIIPPADIPKIKQQVVNLYQQWERGGIVIDPDLDVISSYERSKLTGRLANLLTEICS